MSDRSARPIILLTDFGRKDAYAGILKGVIASISPDTRVIDLSHEVRAQDIGHGAYLLSTAYAYFPKGSIFCVIVDPGVGSDRSPVCIETRDYYFVGPDNGVLFKAAQRNRIKKVIRLTNSRFFLAPVSNTFHGRDIFSPVAAHLSKGIDPIEQLGEPVDQCMEYDFPIVEEKKDGLKLTVLSVDHFGNLILNLSLDKFREVFKDKPFHLTINRWDVREFYPAYALAPDDQPVLIQGSSGNLEIAVKNGNAARMINAREMDTAFLKHRQSLIRPGK